MLAAGVAIVLFVSAGQWQHRRMEQKLALRAQLDAAVAKAPVPLPAPDDWVSRRYRPSFWPAPLMPRTRS